MVTIPTQCNMNSFYLENKHDTIQKKHFINNKYYDFSKQWRIEWTSNRLQYQIHNLNPRLLSLHFATRGKMQYSCKQINLYTDLQLRTCSINKRNPLQTSICRKLNDDTNVEDNQLYYNWEILTISTNNSHTFW